MGHRYVWGMDTVPVHLSVQNVSRYDVRLTIWLHQTSPPGPAWVRCAPLRPGESHEVRGWAWLLPGASYELRTMVHVGDREVRAAYAGRVAQDWVEVQGAAVQTYPFSDVFAHAYGFDSPT